METEAIANDIVMKLKVNLLADGKSLSTVASYVGDISAFLEWLEDKGVEFQGQLHRVHVTAYRRLLVEAGYESATVNKKINSLSSVNSYLIGQGLTQEKAVDPRRDRVKVAEAQRKRFRCSRRMRWKRCFSMLPTPEKSASGKSSLCTCSSTLA